MEAEDKFIYFWVGECTIGHGRLDHCGAYRVYADATVCGFKCGGPGEPDNAVLARAIGSCSSRTYQARDRRHVYNRAPAALLKHLANFVFEAQPRALEIYVNGAIPVFFRLFDDGNPGAFDAGIIEGHIE